MENIKIRICEKRCVANVSGRCIVEICKGPIVSSSDFHRDDPQITAEQYAEICDYIDELLRRRECYNIRKTAFEEYFSQDCENEVKHS